MAIKSQIIDGGGSGLLAHVHHRNGDFGLKVFTEELKEKTNLLLPVINPEFGIEMAIDASFGGTPIHIHDGTDTPAGEWTGTVISGSKFTFDSTDRAQSGTKSVKTLNASLGDTIQFDKGSSQALSAYSGLSLYIYVNSNWAGSSGDSIEIYGYDTGAGAMVGTSVKLENYFNETVFGQWHKLSILFDDMNLSTSTVDSFRIEIVDKASAGPTWYLDDLQIEETGGGQRFDLIAPKGTKYFLKNFRYTFIDAYDPALLNNSMYNLSYDQILGEAALANGITLSLIKNGSFIFSSNIHSIGDILKGGSNLINAIFDGTNTSIITETVNTTPLVLDSRQSDRLSVTINDDLTGLLSFTAIGNGYTQII